LRPTESKILFLQQLGRGLRLSDEKSHLVVLDFIGNHFSSFHKPQALFGVEATYTALATFARQAAAGQLDLPEGCLVNYDLQLIDFLASLDSTSTRKDYEVLRSSLGRRPTLTEFRVAGASLQRLRQQHGSWFKLVEEMQDLDPAEARVLGTLRSFLSDVEITSMTKSFKMVLLQALLELDGLTTPPTLRQLAARSWEVLHRRPRLLADLTDEVRQVRDGQADRWLRYWQQNPVNAWTGASSSSAIAPAFRVHDDRFLFSHQVGAADVDTASNMIQELVDERLASYEARLPSVSSVVAITSPATARVELPYFPDLQIACGHFRAGRTDAKEHRVLPPRYGQLDPQRHFIARATGNSMDGGKLPIKDGDYLLLERDNASSQDATMVLERQDELGQDQYLLRTLVRSPEGLTVLRANNPDYPPFPATEGLRLVARLKGRIEPIDMQMGKSLMREGIPALFGETFNPGSWNSGHVVLHETRVSPSCEQ
jgi:SOS-response transcriptional repressor LexA